MSPDEYCRQKAAARGSTCYYAFLFLPPERRRAVTALYALRRELNEVVAQATDLSLAQTRLAWWRAEIGRLGAGDPQHPVTRALAASGIGGASIGELVDGAEADLLQTRYADFAALERHCLSTDGALAQLVADALGRRDPRTLDYARELGVALRLTAIIRDVGADARRNRIYLPIEDLKAYGVAAADITGARHSEAFAALMRRQARRTESYYGRALEALPAEDRRAQRPGLILAAIQRSLLAEIEGDGFRVLERRVALTPLRRLWIAWRTWSFGA